MVNIYVLKLEDKSSGYKYYIGKTNNDVSIVYSQHKNNKDCEWTTKYPPIELFETFKSEYSLDEDKVTKLYMKKYGIDNVRGGSYSTLELDENVIKSLEYEISSNDITVGEIYSGAFKEMKTVVEEIDQYLNLFQQQKNLANEMHSNFFNFSKKKDKEFDNRIKELDKQLGMIQIKHHVRRL